VKTILLYTRRNVGLCALSYFVAAGFRVKVISDDDEVLALATNLRCEIVTQGTAGDWDWLFSVHWHKIIPEKHLKPNRGVNWHPLLHKYLGKDPVRRYMDNGDTMASLGSHIMTDVPDAGQKVDLIMFGLGAVSSYAEFYNAMLPIYYQSFRRTLDKLNIKP